MTILSQEHEALLREERRLLSDLRSTLMQFGLKPEDAAALEESILQLDDFFLLVVVGEFNAGKSSFINALLGQGVLKEGVTPTTTEVNILRYGEVSRQVMDDHVHVLTAPVAFLREISMVDTPGTNAVIREHEEITARFVPRADLVLFITSADRPFTESERAFLERIRDWGKKVIVIINKVDILESPEDLAQIRDFVAEKAQTLLGIRPQIFPVSARLALRAKHGEPQLWEASRFGALETYIHDTLDERSRLQLKFLNPLGVGRRLTSRYLDEIEARLALLQTDVDTLADVERQLEVYRQDMRRDFEFRMADISNILYEMEQRGVVYFDDLMRLARVMDLLNKERIQTEFQEKVVADTPQAVEKKVGQLIDWLVDADLRQWQAVTEHVAERRRQYEERIVGGKQSSAFHYDRERLIEGIGRQAERVVKTYDRELEAQKIAEGAQAAVAAAAALEVGAVGLGALVTALATTLAMDVTGVLLASLVAALGLFVIPARRRKVKRELHEKVSAMRAQLLRALRTHFEQEIERSLQHINETIAPYTRFVRAEREQNTSARERLQEIDRALGRLEGQIREL